MLTLLNITGIDFIASSNVLNLFPFEQKAWEVAQAPFKNLLMMGFMMWMAGSTVHLFSIGITFSALWQPISALQGVGKGKITVNFFHLQLLFYFDFSMLRKPLFYMVGIHGKRRIKKEIKDVLHLNLKSTNFTYLLISIIVLCLVCDNHSRHYGHLSLFTH